MADNLAKIKEAENTQFNELFQRMDYDKDLITLKPYTMRDENSRPFSDVHNVTLPLPAIKGGRIISYIAGALQQTVVESKDDKKEVIVENFLDDVDREVDRQLSLRGQPQMSSIQAYRLCMRGRIGDKICLQQNDTGGIDFNITPLDGRWFVYGMGIDGMAWGAPRYVRTSEMIETEYGEKWAMKVKGKGIVRDFWSKDINEVYVGENKVFDQENTYGYPPFVMQLVPAGTLLDDDDMMANQGESIFEMVRNVYTEINRFGTILSTLTQKSFLNNLQLHITDPDAIDASKISNPNDLNVRKVYPVEKDGGFKPMPIEDTYNSSRLFWGILSDLEQKGTISDMNFGTLTFPLSAVAISKLTDARDKMILPRLQAKAIYKQAQARMIIRQFIDLGGSTEIGSDGHSRSYNAKDLEGQYYIGYRFFTPTNEDLVAKATIANSMGEAVSDDYKRREIYQLQDPDGEAVKVDSEKAYKTDPILALKRQAHALVDKEQYLDSYLVALNGVALLQQRLGGNPQLMEQKGNPSQANLLDVFGGGAGGPMPRGAAEVQKARTEASLA